MREAENIQVSGREIKLTNPDKVLFDNGITKRDLVEYYVAAAPVMLPLMQDRPVVMMRFPDGIGGQRIVQKNTPEYFPEWISRARVPKRDGGVVSHVICEDAPTLGYLASQACIEPHIFLSRSGSLDCAQEVVFDLDPPGADTSFDPVRRGALVLRNLLESELGMTTFVKTTGGHGLHVHLPLDGKAGFDSAREFARGVGDLLAARHEDTFTTSQRISGRAGRIYVDVMRNAFAQTVVAPYGVRGRPGAPVATPLAWTEVSDASLTPGRFGLRDLPARLADISAGKDPWAGFWRRRYGVAAAQRKLADLGS
ncbi:MAG TPA: non-homologous end-joining DNA ligase [Streptosporangiaceae bacterium]|nr:non-homologous end-joining DNA ligase [Streptosporangiaceae bacterium]